jgi:hypothetical protein
MMGICLLSKPVRIQRQRTKGWRMPPNTVYVGRPTVYGNDYKAGDIHPYALPENLTTPADVKAMTIDAQGAVDLYRLAVATAGVMTGRTPAFPELRGKNLACWCAHDQPCHADVLLELANAPSFPQAKEVPFE